MVLFLILLLPFVYYLVIVAELDIFVCFVFLLTCKQMELLEFMAFRLM